MKVGKFSVSLNVKDIRASREFYEKLGFGVVMGDEGQNWLILSNDQATIGLFHGMFDSTILTFNPGWDSNAQPVDDFTDIRELQAQLKGQGVTFDSEAEAEGQGPASFMIKDPDGNTILFDQHV
jgi:catechol 2,3-dioxygenase-like lactoylglutathione lyase family enzyme